MEFWAAVFLFAVGFVMSVLIPTWQTPDEETHVKAFGKAIRNDSFHLHPLQHFLRTDSVLL